VSNGTISLADTSRGKSWLRNFSADDAAVAARLLHAIRYFSDSQFRAEMKKLLTATYNSAEQPKTAVFAIHSLPKNVGIHYFECLPAHNSTECIPQPTAGSELIVLNILEKLRSSQHFLVHPTVNEMRLARVRRIVLVTDQIVTGQEAQQYAQYIIRNPSIRSWMSFGWIEVEILSHSISNGALATLGSNYPVHFEYLAKDFETSGWSVRELEEVRDFCRRYTSASKEPLGRGDVESLQAYGHTVGNGLPGVLRQPKRKGGGEWAPLLPHDRSYGFSSEEILDSRHEDRPNPGLAPRPSKQPSLRRTEALRVALDTKTSTLNFGRNARPIAILLGAIDAGNRSASQVASAADMSTSRFKTIASVAHQYNLVDNYPSMRIEIERGEWDGPSLLRLTPEGRTALRRLQRAGVRLSKRAKRIANRANVGDAQDAVVVQPPSAYYPQSLR
jgi:hypothetical protein